jgi:hypothetical protein
LSVWVYVRVSGRARLGAKGWVRLASGKRWLGREAKRPHTRDAKHQAR